MDSLKKYVTKRNVINILCFLQFLLVGITEIYIFSEETTKLISLLLLVIGYWLNTDKVRK